MQERSRSRSSPEKSQIFTRVASLRALCANLRQRLTTARTQQALLAQVLVENSV